MAKIVRLKNGENGLGSLGTSLKGSLFRRCTGEHDIEITSLPEAWWQVEQK